MNQIFQSPAAGPFGRRLKRERGTRIPVIIVTGFLGAGKTTLLNRFLKTEEGRGTVVVVNEFGEVGIDDALLRSSADETVLLGNGCLCCTVRSDLQIALRKLVSDRECGKIPDFRRIVIETSGLADPSPILQSFATDRALGGEFHVEAVVTVIDAAAGEATLGWSAEARKQAILADRLIVSKTDLTSDTGTATLITKLNALNPRASVGNTVHGALDPRRLVEPADETRNTFVAEASHTDGIGSFVLTDTRPINWTVFAHAMDTLQSLRGSDLLRVKGLLNVEGCRGPVVVQMVQHLSHPPAELEAWPDRDHSSRLVFITRNISEAQVRGLLVTIGALAQPS